jgi:phage baseplate assembly protein gpV
LGETVIFQGKRLIIGKICSCLAGQELQHTYILLSRVMGTCSEEDNINITGASLKANVVHVDKAKALIKIQLDENADNAGNRWFDFATVYSTSDGTGWYCMPEVGDEVRLVFPDKSEENAYVSSCVHIENESRMNPDEKSWKNKQGKEVLFTPETLVLRNNKGMSIEISDVEGIKIVSDKKIILQAAEDINVNSESGLQLSAAESMLLSQGGASIQMNDSITIGGGKIYMN